jgi:hypothetical protein
MSSPEAELAEIKWRWQQAPLGPYREENGVVVDIRGVPLSMDDAIVLRAWEDIQALIGLLESPPEQDPAVDDAYRCVCDAQGVLDDTIDTLSDIDACWDEDDLCTAITDARDDIKRAVRLLDEATTLIEDME